MPRRTGGTAIPPPGAPPGPPASAPVYTYQQKYIRCKKAGCRTCTDGPGHGPYWYAFWREGGRTRSRYLGKHPPPGALAPPTPAPAPAPAAAPAPTWRVATLGRFAVWRDEEPIPQGAWPRRKALALFKLLLSSPGRRLTREQAIDQLWPDEDPEEGDVGLRSATYGLRRALDPATGDSVLLSEGGALALVGGDRLWLDAAAFAEAAASALAGGEIEACRAALALYGGEYLPGDLYEDWATGRREELAQLRLALLLHQARLCGEHGDLAEARAALAAVLAADPAHEEAAGRQMALLAAMGEGAEALKVYERLRDALREQYAVEPGAEVAGLARRLRAQQLARPAPAPAPPAERPRHTNLPAAPSSFIGREGAQDAVRGMLGASRLVTLTGPGGSGKTRLAVRVAESVLERYPDGVWLCELAGLPPATQRTAAPPGGTHGSGAPLGQSPVGVDSRPPGVGPDPVAAALAGALGLVEEPGRPLAETICGFLEPRRLLLVLDNCEHLLDPVAALVVQILASCPGVSVLLTSQEALGLPEEAVWTVPPLALPPPGQRHAPEGLEAYDAIRLFVERARARRPGFALDGASAPLVLEVCRRLDGIPLAIELAAARLAFLSLSDLAARLGDRFGLLVGGSRVALPRQQTLRAAMEWSHGLLGERERALLRRLTVFAGGWTLAAAEGVCADAALPEVAVLDALGGLVAKSLVAVQGEGGEPPRYGLLETVRQYGQERLAEHGEGAAFRQRHLAWFAGYCEAEIANWTGTDQAALLRRLDADLENIRAALAWGLGPDGDSEAALRLASALSRYWTTRGLVSEGRRWTAGALDAAPRAPARLRATALNRCAILARMEGDHSGASVLWEASLALFRDMGDVVRVAHVVGNLGLLRYDQGDDVAAEEALTESLALKRLQGDQPAMAETLVNLGMVLTRQRRYPEAEAAFVEAGAVWQVLGDQVSLGETYLHTAHLAREQEQLDRAAQLYAASLRISLALGHRPRLASALEGTAHVLLRRSIMGTREQIVLELSTQLFACAAALRESTGVPLPTESQRVYLPDLQQLQSLLGPSLFEAAWVAGWDMPAPSLIDQIPAWPDGCGDLPTTGMGSGTTSITPLPMQ